MKGGIQRNGRLGGHAGPPLLKKLFGSGYAFCLFTFDPRLHEGVLFTFQFDEFDEFDKSD